MPTTLTLKNIPDNIYARLKETAQANHRSLNNEVIACLEKTFLPRRFDPKTHLEEARLLRESLTPAFFSAEEIKQAIEEGRP